MTVILFIAVLFALCVLWIASPLPGAPLFMIALFSLYVLPYRQSLAVVLVAGVLADLFSPIKGLSTVTYLFGFIAARFLSRHVVDYRTCFGSMILFVGMSAVVGYVSIFISFGLDVIRLDDRAAAGAYALTASLLFIPWLLISIPVALLLYGLSRLIGNRTSV
ncbi:hypothetical protein HY623_01460 [Candidatus Uhrbacteria bacterium]|nr:hypothetical protein [Candidatus Uhrbacteria bacterium]